MVGVIVSVLLIAWAIAHLLFATKFATGIVTRAAIGSQRGDEGNGSRQEPHPAESDPTYAPPVSVIMALRGFDPSLRSCLQALLQQDYREYEVIIVIDHPSDAAWRAVEEVTREFDTHHRVRYMALENPRPNCSLKCSSLIQAYSYVNEQSEVLALIDADVVPHANWMRDLVTPLADPTIGASTGNKWYCPGDNTFGSLLRCLWNAGALVPTAAFANPWAGTCALRISDVERSGLVETWKDSAVDDGPIRQALEPFGLRIHFEPKLIMINRDRCTAEFASRYVTRMLTWSRMYEATFLNTFVHMLVTTLLIAISVSVLVLALLTGHFITALIVASGLAVWNLLMLGAFFAVRSGVSVALKTRSETLERMSWTRLFKLYLLLPVCQIAHCRWTLSAIFSKQVHWRDVTYRLNGSKGIEMVEYQPYQSTTDRTPSQVSI